MPPVAFMTSDRVVFPISASRVPACAQSLKLFLLYSHLNEFVEPVRSMSDVSISISISCVILIDPNDRQTSTKTSSGDLGEPLRLRVHLTLCNHWRSTSLARSQWASSFRRDSLHQSLCNHGRHHGRNGVVLQPHGHQSCQRFCSAVRVDG